MSSSTQTETRQPEKFRCNFRQCPTSILARILLRINCNSQHLCYISSKATPIQLVLRLENQTHNISHYLAIATLPPWRQLRAQTQSERSYGFYMILYDGVKWMHTNLTSIIIYHICIYLPAHRYITNQHHLRRRTWSVFTSDAGATSIFNRLEPCDNAAGKDGLVLISSHFMRMQFNYSVVIKHGAGESMRTNHLQFTDYFHLFSLNKWCIFMDIP